MIPSLDAGREEVIINHELSTERLEDVKTLMSEYDGVFSALPGCTDAIVHDIKLITSEPFRSKCYPVPLHLEKHFESEVDKLLELGIIQPSTSPYSSPVVMVKKPDSTYRLTIDYRALNALTVFHAEPPCLVEEQLHKFLGASIFSELDLNIR